jgi:hypothetical protein
VTRLLVALFLSAYGGALAPAPAPPATPSDAAVPQAGPSDAECSALLDHAISVVASSHNATETDRTKLRAELEAEFLPKCRAMAIASYRCATAATTADALAACDSAQP